MTRNDASDATPRVSPKVIVQAALAALAAVAGMAALLFVPAGTWDYWPGWAYTGLCVLYMGAGTPWIILKAPDLLQRRLKFGPGAEKEPAQKVLMALSPLFAVSLFVLAGLDRRYGWSAVPAGAVAAGLLLVLTGMALAVAASLHNHYAAATITVEEGQPVISTGPYAWVRHPMYCGVLLWFGATPLALASWWAFAPAVMIPFLLALRIGGEEKYLREHLPGYAEYCAKVRWRLVPGIY